MKRASDSAWVVFTLTLVGSGLVVIAFTALLMSADQCSSNTGYCGGVGKTSAQVMLLLSATWFFYLVIRFARDPDKF